MNNDPSSTDPAATAPKPVAYDSEGRPLYAAPPTFTAEQQQVQATPQVVHLSRAVTPVKPEVTPEVKARHDDSIAAYPSLNLSDSEFIISAVRRHPIGLFLPVSVTVMLVAIILSLTVNLPAIMSGIGFETALDLGPLYLGGILLTILFLLGGYIAIWVYMNNRFFLTNESVIQEIQSSLFAHHEQTVSLSNIEDASYEQKGIIQTIFNYGSIRLSTEGDETTYRFNYVAHPKKQIAILNNAVEAFKNGRPVDQLE
jgi:hypothetical protein